MAQGIQDWANEWYAVLGLVFMAVIAFVLFRTMS